MALTPTGTRELLARLGHSPKRFLGQNFLVDGNIVRKSVELAQVAPGDAVAEVGPGLGTLTEALLEAGAEVWAVELDRTLHAHLEEGLARRYPGTFHLKEGDAVEFPLAGMPAELAPQSKVVANLPYAISTPWMDAVLTGPLPVRLVLMLQKEAADRYGAAPGGGNFGAISIFLQAAYDIAPGHKVSPACFHPRPEVDSALLHLVRKPEPFVFGTEDKAIVRRCFQQRRKQIGAIIREQMPARESGWM
ncbi:MAG TPA: 16S rRNA (adenine(1518)-N(6)/adenine(1519)-N(6))-dimethyltransferase RsmA, partial [Opitutaceae bacterium]